MELSERIKKSRLNLSMMLESAQVDALANQAATSPENDLPEPTQAQKEAGNYKKGRLTFAGFPIAIENPKGSLRKGVDAGGTEWSIEMQHHYGDLSGTRGADGDPVDVFLGENEEPENVYVVNQVNLDGSFDEHKVMLGFDSKLDARRAYLSNYEDDWQGLGSITTLTLAQFREWIKKGNTQRPASPPSRFVSN